ncbi:MAG: hypothetical protein KBD01_19450 [Acidobacteria bacterium]|nr:hypothetical protein [Acidobacteriota bacterium]
MQLRMIQVCITQLCIMNPFRYGEVVTKDVPSAPRTRGPAAILSRGRAERDDRRRARHEPLFREPSSPFFKSLRVLEVGEFPRATSQQFLDKPFTAGRRRVSVEAFDHVFELAERNPSDVQQLCAALWDVTDVGGGVMPEQVQRALTYCCPPNARARALNLYRTGVLAVSGGGQPPSGTR